MRGAVEAFPPTTKRDRDRTDSEAPLGIGTTFVWERLAASMGALAEAPVRFEPAVDVAGGGILWALPALLATGLLRHSRAALVLPKGFYSLASVLLLLAWMALARVRSMEQLRYQPPGEWGRLLGYDRIPEVRTLRAKVKRLSGQKVETWAATLCDDWMRASPESVGLLYVDGHVRVYHGTQTKLPRHYVARERLCLRATTDYWVNALDGQPFFYVNQPVDPGLVKVLKETIVPELMARVPAAPRALDVVAAQKAPPWLTLIFDREGYSPELFSWLLARGICSVTYRKAVRDRWEEDEFLAQPVTLSCGETVTMALAERGVRLSDGAWVREIRKRTETRQVAMVTTDRHRETPFLTAALFGRWSQENFFRYMRQEYGIDKLVTYATAEVAETTRVVNPAYRDLDGTVRKKVAELSRTTAAFGALELTQTLKDPSVRDYTAKKAALYDTLVALKEEVDTLKAQRKDTPKHILIKDLPQEARFKQLAQPSKQFIDTTKLIAYRAETAMAQLLRPALAREEDARNLLRAIYQTDADLLPDYAQKTLTVHLHHLANHAQTAAIRALAHELNATETSFPGTDLRLVYEIGVT